MKRTPANDTHCRQSYRTEQFVEYFYTFGIDSNTAFSEYINFAKPFEENDRIKPISFVSQTKLLYRTFSLNETLLS